MTADLSSSGPSAPGVSELAKVLRVHEARWTTHGYERPYDVMHCLGDCEWRLRQKVGMDTEAMYAAHRRHVAEVIAGSGVVVPAAEVDRALEGAAQALDAMAEEQRDDDRLTIDAAASEVRYFAAARRAHAAGLAGEGR